MITMQPEYMFHPVGQGLFSSGVVAAEDKDRGLTSQNFRWVYDCGTTSSQRFVRNAVADLKTEVAPKKLDLVAVSHFDSDHISGLVQLLNEVRTKILMLPWAPLAHRLLIGYQQDLAPDDPEFDFYVDPVAYLTGAAPDGFDEIVFVPFGGDEGPPEPDGEDRPLDFDSGGELIFDVSREDLSAELIAQDNIDREKPKVSMLAHGSTLTVFGFWEFVPYNDPLTRPKDLGVFQSAVNQLRTRLLSGDKDDTKGALRDLKTIYVTTFPKSQLNDLSLFLYGGPIGNWSICWPQFWHGHILLPPSAASIIYTGDGDFSSPERWETFRDYVGPKRALQPFVFQVPHHGSKKNWHSGLASTLSSTLSIFSSDPSRRGFGHPHGEVLRDFWGHQMAQVDKQRSFRSRLLLFQNSS